MARSTAAGSRETMDGALLRRYGHDIGRLAVRPPPDLSPRVKRPDDGEQGRGREPGLPLPPMGRRGLMLMGCLLLAGCGDSPATVAGAGTVAGETEVEPAGSSTSPEPEPELPLGPELTPQQVWDKLMAMIDAIERPEDLNQANIERAIGLPLTRQSKPDERYRRSVVGDTTQGWRYIFSYVDYGNSDVRVALDAYRWDHDEVNNSPTCTWRTEGLRAVLRERGFEERNETFPADRAFTWHYSRGPKVIRVRYYFNAQDYDYDNTCVDYVLLTFAPPTFQAGGRSDHR